MKAKAIALKRRKRPNLKYFDFTNYIILKIGLSVILKIRILFNNILRLIFQKRLYIFKGSV